jgi:hypothetical protein
MVVRLVAPIAASISAPIVDFDFLVVADVASLVGLGLGVVVLVLRWRSAVSASGAVAAFGVSAGEFS